ncbi:MAG: chorismate synthase [Acidobacteriota bacterium]
MAGNSFGQALRLTTAGESHGAAQVMILDGVPPGLELSEEDLLPDLERRRPGQSRIVTQRKEPDRPRILSGVFEGKTTGTSIALVIENVDQRSRDYAALRDVYRPGHADYTFDAKYGRRDMRGGGRSSARETAMRVAAGAIAKKLLAAHGVRVLGWVTRVGAIEASITNPADVTLEQVEATPVRCPDPEAAARMIELIEQVRAERDSIGGVAEIVALGVPPGWGEPVFDKLKADLGKAMFSLPAVLGVEYGAGFAVATARGSDNNDCFVARDGLISTRTNRHGGMLGGLSTGLPIVVRCAVKPTSSLPQEQETVDRHGEAATVVTRGRHDPCLLPRFVPMGEAMMALVLADHWLRHRGQTGRDGSADRAEIVAATASPTSVA